jgi:hypothetical protein
MPGTVSGSVPKGALASKKWVVTVSNASAANDYDLDDLAFGVDGAGLNDFEILRGSADNSTWAAWSTASATAKVVKGGSYYLEIGVKAASQTKLPDADLGGVLEFVDKINFSDASDANVTFALTVGSSEITVDDITGTTLAAGTASGTVPKGALATKKLVVTISNASTTTDYALTGIAFVADGEANNDFEILRGSADNSAWAAWSTASATAKVLKGDSYYLEIGVKAASQTKDPGDDLGGVLTFPTPAGFTDADDANVTFALKVGSNVYTEDTGEEGEPGAGVVTVRKAKSALAAWTLDFKVRNATEAAYPLNKVTFGANSKFKLQGGGSAASGTGWADLVGSENVPAANAGVDGTYWLRIKLADPTDAAFVVGYNFSEELAFDGEDLANFTVDFTVVDLLSTDVSGPRTSTTTFSQAADWEYVIAVSYINSAADYALSKVSLTGAANALFDILGSATEGGSYTALSGNINKPAANGETNYYLKLKFKSTAEITTGQKVVNVVFGDYPSANVNLTLSVTKDAAGELPTADNMFWGRCANAEGEYDCPLGRIKVEGGVDKYEPGSGALKIAAPKIEVTRDGVKSGDYVIYSIEYKPAGATAAEMGGAVTYYYSGSSLSDKGVRTILTDKNSDGVVDEDDAALEGAYVSRDLVAGLYDVTVTVAKKEGVATSPEIVGVSLPVTYEVTRKDLTTSMLTVELSNQQKIYSATPKSPIVTVKDGSRFLQQEIPGGASEIYYDWAIANQEEIDEAVNVGKWPVSVTGFGNYRGTIKKEYEIVKAELSFYQFAEYEFEKTYDGTTAVRPEDAENFAQSVVFTGYPSAEENELGNDDYIIKEGSLKYGKKDVGTGITVTATIELANTEMANNYKLKTNSFTYSYGVITKGTPTASLLKVTYDNPAKEFVIDGENQALYNKSAKEVKVAWAAGVSNSGSKFTVKYGDEQGTTKPVDINTYAVSVEITAGSNLTAATLELGSLNIVEALSPVITETTPEDVTYYAKSSVTLKVEAKSPQGKTSGLTYQWFRVSENGLDTLKGKTSASLVINDTTVGTRQYQVQVTYKGQEQVAASAMSRAATVITLPAPVSLRGAIIVANGTYEYDGAAKNPPAADLSVSLGGLSLDPATDFVIQSIRNNVNAGEGVITIKGIGAYKETEVGTFTIAKKQVDLSDLQITYGTDYNGTTQEIRVSTVSGKSGLGEVTRIYDSDSARLNAGSWNVELAIAEGQNFEAVESLPLSQPYVIRRALIDESLLTYTGVPKEIAWNGQSQAIAKPTLKGVGTFYTGDLKVVYTVNGEEVDAVVDSALYTVKVVVAGDRNFSPFSFDLGTIEIHGKEWTGVKDGSREIPGKKTVEQVAIAPVKVVAGEVAVGPNPVANGSSLNIFWNGSKAVSGKLAVYTTMGKKVAVVPVSGSKKIGTWNTAGAPEGTYLIKGVLNTKDGTKVKVSNLVSVTR